MDKQKERRKQKNSKNFNLSNRKKFNISQYSI